MISTTPIVRAGAAAALVLGLAACGGEVPSGDAAGSAVSSATAAAGSAASSATGAAGSAVTSSTAAAATKVSANNASEDEIKGALEAAGVPNPGRWAEEVVEYRPYPADDPDLTKLRKSLAKYQPGEDTVNKIASALQP